MSDSKPIGLRVDMSDINEHQLHMIVNHIYAANSMNWKPDWLGSEVGHTWKKEDAWVVLREETGVTLYPKEGLDTFDMLSFLHFVGIKDDKIWRNG